MGWLAGLATVTALARTPLSPSEQGGKLIYFQGLGSGGRPIPAVVSGMEVPATLVPCITCHGHDGRGRAEGGVEPPDIRWAHLTRRDGHRHPSGRAHPPFTESTFRQAVTAGIDPAGTPLAGVMPRYRMTPSELADLIAFLKRLGTVPDPGVADRHLRVGTLLPTGDPWGDVSTSLRALWEAYLRDVNAAGGIFGRHIELYVAMWTAAADIPDAFRRLIREGDVFAVLGPWTGNADRDVARIADESGVPVIAPLTLFPTDEPGRYVFYLLAGLREQTQAMLDFIERRWVGSDARVAVLHAPEAPYRDVADLIERQAQRRGWPPVTRRTEPAPIDPAGPILFLVGPPDRIAAWLPALEAVPTKLSVLIPGFLAGRPELLETLGRSHHQVYLATPMGFQEDVQADAVEYVTFLQRHRVVERYPALQRWAYGAVRLFVEGLRRAGRSLDRERFVDALEDVDGLQTGVLPPIRYRPGRRVGAAGAYVLAVDGPHGALVRVSDWMPIP